MLVLPIDFIRKEAHSEKKIIKTKNKQVGKDSWYRRGKRRKTDKIGVKRRPLFWFARNHCACPYGAEILSGYVLLWTGNRCLCFSFCSPFVRVFHACLFKLRILNNLLNFHSYYVWLWVLITGVLAFFAMLKVHFDFFYDCEECLCDITALIQPSNSLVCFKWSTRFVNVHVSWMPSFLKDYQVSRFCPVSGFWTLGQEVQWIFLVTYAVCCWE